jgi:hypothetical protein
MYNLKTIFLSLLVVGVMAGALPAQAQLSNDVNGVAATFNIPAGNNLAGTVGLIVNWLLSLVGIVAVIFIVYGGLLYITSQGDEKKAEAGKRVVIFAVIGLIIIGISAVVVNFVLSAIHNA